LLVFRKDKRFCMDVWTIRAEGFYSNIYIFILILDKKYHIIFNEIKHILIAHWF
jgi:hypothetical protein